MTQRKVLVVSDFACATGFARVMENLLTRIDQKAWLPYILAVNYQGDPHPLQKTFAHMYPARLGGDAYGVKRFAEMVRAIKPDLILIQSDAWLVPLYLERAKLADVTLPPVIAYCPPDSKNQPAGRLLTQYGVTLLITPTEFGRDELVAGGYTGPTKVIPYGVDTTIYKPMNQTEARVAMHFPEDRLCDFVVGRADRNAKRKRYDLTVEGFAKWWVNAGQPSDAWLYCHCAVEDIGVNILQLARFWGRELFKDEDAVESRLMYTAPDLAPGVGVTEARMPLIYNTWNLHLAPVMGEGGGLVALESGACRVPQALVKYAAHGEWWQDAAYFMKVRAYHATDGGGVNTLGGVTSVDDVQLAISQAYAGWKHSYPIHEEMAEAAYDRATSDQFNWDRIAADMMSTWNEVWGG